MRKLTKLKVQKNFRKVIVEIVVILMGAKSLEDLKHLFGLFCIILLNKKKNKTVEDALKEMKCMSDNSFVNYDDGNDMFFNINDGEEDERVRGKYTESPFYVCFLKIYLNISEQQDKNINNDGEVKQLESQSFVDYIVRYCMPFAPLWTSLTTQLTISKKQRYSNANVEGWFKII